MSARHAIDDAPIATEENHTVAMSYRSITRTLFILAGLLLAGLTSLPAIASAAVTPGAGWELHATSYPSNIAPGGKGLIEVQVFNIGEKDSQGQVTVTDTLPAGLVAFEGAEGERYSGAGETSGEQQVHHLAWVCTGNGPGAAPNIDGATEVTCKSDPEHLSTFPGGGGNPTFDCCGLPAPAEHPVLPVIGIGVKVTEAPTEANFATISGGEGGTASTTNLVGVSAKPRPFGFSGFDGWFSNADGTADFQAGSHPYEWTTQIDLASLLEESGALTNAGQEPHNIITKLPPGLIVNPQAVGQCNLQQLDIEKCPPSSLVGVITVMPAQFPPRVGLQIFNLVPPPGEPGELAFVLNGINTFIHSSVRTGSDYGITSTTATIPQREIIGATLTLWGVPGDPSHDRWRDGVQGGDCPTDGSGTEYCAVPEPPFKPFLTLPTSCAGPQSFPGSVDAWFDSSLLSNANFFFHDQEGSPQGFTGCTRLPFSPTVQAKPTTNVTDSPSGLEFDLHLPQSGFEDPEAEASEADLKGAVVTLPKGLVVNPSSANGLDACSSAQFGLTSAVGAKPITTTPGPASCPDSSKIGSVEIDSSLLDHPAKGSVYLAAPKDNPFGSLLAIYLAVNDPQSGTVIKLAGHVEPDPSTGRLVTRFDENPQLPFEEFHLNFFGGAHAALRTPTTCGTYEVATDMTPWSSPEGADAFPSDSFELTQGAGGAPCVSHESELPAKPAFTAGTLQPKAGTYSPFILHLARQDGSQEIKGIDTTLPEGLIGKLAGVKECSDAQIAQAASRNKVGDGALEQSSPSCPQSSEVGTVNVGAGAGPAPYYVSGHAYLAGPYKGAPLSLEIITPAIAGPYDLGSVAIRTALFVNPETTQIHAVSDEIPHILQGIPLDVRSIDLQLNRNQFTLNPTSCEKKTVLGAATLLAGQSTALSSPFQVGECKELAFKPKLAIALKGATKRHTFPALKATLTYPNGASANIAKAQVTLPHSEFLEQSHIKTICTRVQFAEGAVPGEKCPAASIYGRARAVTPLLDQPLEGPVYLRSSSHNLPDLVAALNGQINVDLDGRIDSVHAALRSTFEMVPDAPVSKFTLEMQGGRKGLLVNSTNICNSANSKALVALDAQNGKADDFEPVVTNSCKGKAKKHKKVHKGRKGKH